MTPEQQADIDAWNRMKRFEYDSRATQQAFQEWFGISPAPARLLECFYLKPNTFFAASELVSQSKTTPKSFHWALMKLRDALASGSFVVSKYWQGQTEYGLTARGLEECLDALNDWQSRQEIAA